MTLILVYSEGNWYIYFAIIFTAELIHSSLRSSMIYLFIFLVTTYVSCQK